MCETLGKGRISNLLIGQESIRTYNMNRYVEPSDSKANTIKVELSNSDFQILFNSFGTSSKASNSPTTF